MLIVTGTVTATPEHLERLRDAALAHVNASRLEPGCISHEVAIDCEDSLRLVFFERWTDRAALERHFRAESAGRFVDLLRALGLRGTGPVIDEIVAPRDPAAVLG